MLDKIRNWRRNAGVKGFGPGISHSSKDGWYVKWAPNFGVSLTKKNGDRLRIALHHGIQLVSWNGRRWIIKKQLFGKSRVKGELPVRKG